MYEAPIRRDSPGCLILMLDQSRSMATPWGDDGATRATVLADTVNATIGEAVFRSTIGEKVRDYFRVGVVGYSGESVYDALAPDSRFTSESLRGLEYLFENPKRMEERSYAAGDAAPGATDDVVSMPIWVDAHANGRTPMADALDAVTGVLTTWVSRHPDGHPPIVINVTDAHATGNDPARSAERLRAVGTSDGAALLFNIHIADEGAEEVVFPDTVDIVGEDDAARTLYWMSSVLPPVLRGVARREEIAVTEASRGFARGIDPSTLLAIYDIGTRPLLNAVAR